MVANIPAERVIYRCDTVLGLTESVAAGIGVGLLPCFIADQRAGHASYYGYAIWDFAMLEAWLKAHAPRA